MPNESITTSSKPMQESILPYRVRVTSSTVAAFDNFEDAAMFAKPLIHEHGAVEIVFSMAAI